MSPCFFSILLAAVLSFHDLKMSVCEVVHVPANRNFEVKAYLYTDDLTETITGDPKSALPARDQIVQYVQKHLSLQVNGTTQNLQMVVFRQKDEQVLVQFATAAQDSTPHSILVKNSLLLDKFKEQTNMVYLIVPGKTKKVEALGRDRTTAGWNL